MARKKKPCEWCESEQFFYTEENARNISASIEVYPEEAFMGIVVQGISDDGEMTHEECFDIPMHFCPNCGRELGWL